MWRKAKSILFYCFTPSFNPADFDKNENYELEKEFYENWINQRVMFVPEEIDEENEEDGSLRIAQLQDVENSFQMEMSFIFDKNEAVNSNQGNNIQEVSDSALNSSVSRSSVIRQTKIINSVGSQVDFCHIDQPPVRKVKKCTEKIKTAEKACKISQAFSKKIMFTITIFCIKRNTLSKFLKSRRLLRTTLIMLTYFQIKNDCKTKT